MNREAIEQKAFNYFNAGFHCDEAVSKTVLEAYGREQQYETK